MDQIIDFNAIESKIREMGKSAHQIEWDRFIMNDLTKCKSLILEKILINRMLNNNYWDDDYSNIIEGLIREIWACSSKLYHLSEISLAFVQYQAYQRKPSSYLEIDGLKDIPFYKFENVPSFVIHQALLDLIIVMYQIYPFPPYVLLEIINLTENPIIFGDRHHLLTDKQKVILIGNVIYLNPI